MQEGAGHSQGSECKGKMTQMIHPAFSIPQVTPLHPTPLHNKPTIRTKAEMDTDDPKKTQMTLKIHKNNSSKIWKGVKLPRAPSASQTADQSFLP